MILRSKKQTTPNLILIVTESKTKKRALRKRNRLTIVCNYLKSRFKIRKNNAIIPF
jgi:uncharacterized alpha/beta hydrolase family protein